MKTPAWDIESEYPSLESSEFANDWSVVVETIETIETKVSALDFTKPTGNFVSSIQEILVLHDTRSIVLGNLLTYCNCIESVDATDAAARKKSSELEKLSSRHKQALVPVWMFLKTCDVEIFDSIFSKKELKGFEFISRRSREQAPYLMSRDEETLLSALEISGHNAWGNLRYNLVGTGKVEMRYPDRTETIGLAEAASYTYGGDPVARKVAWTAIQEFWTEHRETGASILNALAGWRHEVYEKRSRKKQKHFLDDPLYTSRIQRETLEAMIETCRKNLPQLRRAPILMAKTMGQNKIAPWDMQGTSPIKGSRALLEFERGLQIVKQGYSSVDPSMGDFAQMMADKNWIEARVLPNKAAGAHCTGFAKSRTPRVFQTYSGSLSDVMTLAHELGHAYHSWVMRDLPRGETHYPMTLAETASVFGETVVADTLFKNARSWEEKVEFGWNDLEGVLGFTINIPMRYELEKEFYERRKSSVVSADELNEITDRAWTTWYGPTVTQNDKLFWAHKMHFAFARISFYNFPYTFGYLFSLSIYARREQYGSKFMKTYVDLLRDTGRMTAEDLVMKHLGEDIRKPEFWQAAVNTVIAKIDNYERIL
ncbi:MAG: M3 family oligoendopeptidase, partial [Bdellovibrionota bacterium]